MAFSDWRSLVRQVQERERERERQRNTEASFQTTQQQQEEERKKQEIAINFEHYDVKKEIFQLLAKRTPDLYNILRHKLSNWESEKTAQNRFYVSTLNNFSLLFSEDFNIIQHILLTTPKAFAKPIFLLNQDDLVWLSKQLASAMANNSEMAFQDFTSFPLLFDIVSAILRKEPLPPANSDLNSAAALSYPMMMLRKKGIDDDMSGGKLLPFEKNFVEKYLLHLGNLLPMYSIVNLAPDIKTVNFVFAVKNMEIKRIGYEGDLPMSVPLDARKLREFMENNEHIKTVVETIRRAVTESREPVNLYSIIMTMYREKKVPRVIMTFDDFVEMIANKDARDKLEKIMSQEKDKIMIWIPNLIDITVKEGSKIKLNLKIYLGYRRYVFNLLAGASMALTKVANMT